MNAMIDAKTVALGTPFFGSLTAPPDALTLPPAFSSGVLDKREGSAASRAIPVWNEAQRLALVSLARAVDEKSVFAALTGEKGSGTSDVLAELLSTSKRKDRICVCIPAPDKVSAKTVGALSDAIDKAISGLFGRSAHILFGIDNAHTATEDLLGLLNRFARSRECSGAPQVVLAGEPELWNRLALPQYQSLQRRFALRCSL